MLVLWNWIRLLATSMRGDGPRCRRSPESHGRPQPPRANWRTDMIVRLLVSVVALALVATAMAQQPDQARSIALFREAGKVLQSPRCLNCHPVGERPTQTDRMTPHMPLVVRGADRNARAGAPGAA